MKRVVILLSVVFLVLVNQFCTEDVDNAINDVDPVLTDDLPVNLTSVPEKKDSLNTGKYIYITIDDAPLKGSEYIDSIITVTKIKTSLFLVGNGIDGNKRFRQYYEKFRENPYIEIYNHSYSHASNRYTAFYKNPEAVLSDFERNQTEFSLSHKIARLPGRNLWLLGERKKNYNQTGASSAGLLAEKGYKVFGWDVEWNYDAKDYNPKQSIDELVKEIENCCNFNKTFTKNHVVLLMHNQMFGKVNDRNDLGELINRLKERGFIFECLSLYPESAEKQ